MRRWKLFLAMVICLVFSPFFLISWFVGLFLLHSRLPKNRRVCFQPRVYGCYWILLLLIFILLPYTSMGIFGSYNGLQLFNYGLSISYTNDLVLLSGGFMLFTVVATILGFVLKNNVSLIGQYLSILLVSITYTFLSISFWSASSILNAVKGISPTLLTLLLIAGLVAMYYVTWRTLSTKQNAEVRPDPRPEIDRPAAPRARVDVSSASRARDDISATPRARVDVPAAPRARANVPAAPRARADVPAAPRARDDAPAAPRARANVPASLKIRCTGGQYAEAEFHLKQGESLSMGSDSTRVNLVFSSPEISGLHCVITCPEIAGHVRLADCSDNGTYLSNGKRLPHGAATELPLPCVIFFGDKPESFEITR